MEFFYNLGAKYLDVLLVLSCFVRCLEYLISLPILSMSTMKAIKNWTPNYHNCWKTEFFVLLCS